MASIARMTDLELGPVPAEVLHEWGVDPRHEGRDGLPGVVARPIALPAHLELHASKGRGFRTLGHDLLDGVVVVLSVVVV